MISPTKEQQDVIDHKDGPLLVIAGPGSGKTYTIVERVQKLVQQGKDAKKILCVTFTEKATEVMASRLEGIGNAEVVEAMTEHLQLSGLKKENIRVLGNPAFDDAFEKRNQTKSNDSNVLRILFITANLGSGQGKTNFSKSNRNKMISKTILNLQELKKEFSLMIKIHPTSENYTEFKQFVGKSENIHVSQKDDIIELLTETDIVITPVTSTAAVIALIMNKPIILWNYFHAEWDLLLRKNVVLECKNETELGYCIDSVEMFRKNNSEKIDQFILERFGSGNTSQLIVNEIFDLIRKQKPQLN